MHPCHDQLEIFFLLHEQIHHTRVHALQRLIEAILKALQVKLLYRHFTVFPGIDKTYNKFMMHATHIKASNLCHILAHLQHVRPVQYQLEIGAKAAKENAW